MGLTYYNRTLLQTIGMRDPAANWSYQDMLRIAQAATVDKDGDGNPETWGISQVTTYGHWLFCYGGMSVSVDGKTSLFNHPARGEAYRFFADFVNRYRVAPPNDVLVRYGAASNSSSQMFLKGVLAMQMSSIAGDLQLLRTNARFDWDIASYPDIDISAGRFRNTTFTPEEFAIPVGSKNAETAWKFMRWVTSADMLAELTRRGHIFPSRLSVAASRAWNNPNVPPHNIMEASNALAYAVPHLSMQHVMGSQINSAAGQMLNNYTNGTMPINTALEEAHKRIQVILDEYNRR